MTKMNFKTASALTALCLSLLPAAADAAGFYLQEQSVSQQGAAFAGAAANPTDASTISSTRPASPNSAARR